MDATGARAMTVDGVAAGRAGVGSGDATDIG